MDDSILDIDEVLSDSFSLPTQDSLDDVTRIVQQWKQAETGLPPLHQQQQPSSSIEDKYLNTRTFTRPKKKVYPKCSSNLFAVPGTPSMDKQLVNLKIGGLVTSMQRSFLGDTSPPSSMCSTSLSSSMLGASLISSNDFSNLNYFMESANTTDPAASRTTHPPPAAPPAASTVVPAADQFECLFDTSQPMFYDTMVNSMCLDEPLADTVEAMSSLGDGTFVNSESAAHDFNDTIVMSNGHAEQVNEAGVYDEAEANVTYDNLVQNNRTLVVADARSSPHPLNVTVNAFSDKQSAANDTFELDLLNVTVNAPRALSGSWGRTLGDSTQADLDSMVYQSTPMKPTMSTPNEFTEHIQFSPIPNVAQPELSLTTTNPPIDDHVLSATTTQSNSTQPIDIYRTYARRPARSAVPPTFDDHSPPDSLQPDERQSLTNFEEFERNSWPPESIPSSDRQSLTNFEEFEKCQTEQDMDQMLHKLTTSEQIVQKDQQMRQSLETIKNRHLATNLEKQQEDLRNKQHPTPLDRSTNSLLSSSGSGERLLRRSRLCDDIVSPKSSMSSSTLSDTKENVQCNFDTTRDTNRMPSDSSASTDRTSITDELEPAHPTAIKSSIPSNRDRFKTIRISKRPSPSDRAVPHIPDEYGDTGGEPTEHDDPVGQPDYGRAPLQTDNRVEGVPRRRLNRPNQLTGLVRRDASLGLTRTIVAPSVIKHGADGLTSPMGYKAKSIHNLATGYEKSSEEVNVGNQKESSPDNFKVPTSLPNQHSRVAKRSGLIRPSSGYYSYNVRRNDSDTESGRMSPTNSLSSGSSKGSLYKNDLASSSDSSEIIKIELKPLADDVPSQPRRQPTPSSSIQPATAPAKTVKRSGIQPPSTFATRKRSGLPRPMSMANR